MTYLSRHLVPHCALKLNLDRRCPIRRAFLSIKMTKYVLFWLPASNSLLKVILEFLAYPWVATEMKG